MAVLRLNGDIVDSDWGEIYEYFGIECITPKKVKKSLDELAEDDTLHIKLNSGGGQVMAGQEIYALLRNRDDVDIEIESLAASAASVIAMAAPCKMLPTALLMVHRAWMSSGGNKNDLERDAAALSAVDEALSAAYCEKSGMSKDDALELMDAETWLTAERALELRLIDGISERQSSKAAASAGLAVTEDMVAEYKRAMQQKKEAEQREAEELKELLAELEKSGDTKGD